MFSGDRSALLLLLLLLLFSRCNISQRAENTIQNIQTLAGCLGNAAGLSDSDNMLHQNTTVLM